MAATTFQVVRTVNPLFVGTISVDSESSWPSSRRRRRCILGCLSLRAGAICLMWMICALPCKSYADVDDLAAVVAILEANSAAFNPIAMEWTREASRNIREERFFDVIKSGKWIRGDTTFLMPIEWSYQHQNGQSSLKVSQSVPRFRFADPLADPRKSLPLFDGTDRNIIEVVFDGDVGFRVDRHGESERPTSMFVQRIRDLDKGDHQGPAKFVVPPCEFFTYTGFAVPRNLAEYTNRPAIRSSVAKLIRENDGAVAMERELNEGEPAIRLVAPKDGGTLTVILDVNRNYAVKQIEERTGGGERVYLAKSSDFRTVPGTDDVWFPHRCDVQVHQWSGRPEAPANSPLFLERFRVTRFDTSTIPNTAFQRPHVDAGAIVADGTLPGADKTDSGEIQYVVPADAADLDRIIEEAIAPARPDSLSRPFWILIVLVLGLSALILLAFLWRRS